MKIATKVKRQILNYIRSETDGTVTRVMMHRIDDKELHGKYYFLDMMDQLEREGLVETYASFSERRDGIDRGCNITPLGEKFLAEETAQKKVCQDCCYLHRDQEATELREEFLVLKAGILATLEQLRKMGLWQSEFIYTDGEQQLDMRLDCLSAPG